MKKYARGNLIIFILFLVFSLLRLFDGSILETQIFIKLKKSIVRIQFFKRGMWDERSTQWRNYG